MTFYLRAILNLFAGFLIAMHCAVLLHEVGHVLGSWASGRRVLGIVMFTPFPAGYVVPKALDSALHDWGGVVFGSLVGVIPLGLARRLAGRPVIAFCMWLMAAFCFAHNGFYLVIGGFIPFGDAADMIAIGAPRWILPLLGLPLLVAYVVVLPSAIRLLGLRASDSRWRWIVPVEAGLLLIPAVMIVPMQFSAGASATRRAMLVLLFAFAASFLWTALRARRSAVTAPGTPQLPQSWACTGSLFAGAAGVIALEWFALLHTTH
jgi:hypothetical protein